MGLLAQVVVNIPSRELNKAFSYAVPDDLAYVTAGCRVMVPFGNRTSEGFIISTEENDISGLKPILTAFDEEPWFDDKMMETAKWISEYYLCSLSEALRLFIPGRASIKTNKIYRLAEITEEINKKLQQKEAVFMQAVTYCLEHKKATPGQLSKLLGKDYARILRYLTKNNILISEDKLILTAKKKFKTILQLAIDAKDAQIIKDTLKGKAAQARVLEALLTQGEIDSADYKTYKISPDAVKRLEAAGMVKLVQEQVLRDSFKDMTTKDQTIELMAQQKKALKILDDAINDEKYLSFLLHGVTGSGKTEVYIQAVHKLREKGKQAIVLVPEIALTGQIVERFKARFGDDVVVIHSKLSVNERADAWQRVKENTAGIVIGARSAIFAPTRNLGLIIIDEEHEFTYKQEENPRYHAKQVALKRAELSEAVVLMGSATPSIESYYEALNGQHELIHMPNRIDKATLPAVTIVDMREEIKMGRKKIFSKPLQSLLEEIIPRGEQAVILLNRRGYATFVMCRECGYVMTCDHCSVSMVYHSAGNNLKCHYCQKTEPIPDVCPSCKSRYIKFFGLGTQKVEEELHHLIPQVKIARMDQDTTGGKMDHHQIISDFKAKKQDVLLGTQMVAKGHDVSSVTAVGIMAADSGLNIPDFRASEKTFDLLTQAAGRAGRGDKLGRVIVQTYAPDHYAILAGAMHDYEQFFANEIENRKLLCYPPFCKLIKLTVQGTSETDTRKKADLIALELIDADKNSKLSVIGPFPAPIARVKDTFRINILIKTADLLLARKLIVDQGLTKRNEVIIDVEPVSVM